MMRMLGRLRACSSVRRAPSRHFRVGAHLLAAVAVAVVFLAGCDHDGDGGHVFDDDFIVSFPSPLAIAIHRPFDQPFDVLEIGVTPFSSPIVGSEPYVLVVSGIASFDGAEVIFEVHDIVPQAFIDPLGGPVVDVLITCDCFVDYVILGSPFGETTLFFD
jgi:hypothetical protein